jgi:hypothetical protein
MSSSSDDLDRIRERAKQHSIASADEYDQRKEQIRKKAQGDLPRWIKQIDSQISIGKSTSIYLRDDYPVEMVTEALAPHLDIGIAKRIFDSFGKTYCEELQRILGQPFRVSLETTYPEPGQRFQAFTIFSVSWS